MDVSGHNGSHETRGARHDETRNQLQTAAPGAGDRCLLRTTGPCLRRPLARSGGGVMGRLGRFVVRHRRAVILSWFALLIVTATIGSSAFSVLSTDFGAGTSTES